MLGRLVAHFYSPLDRFTPLSPANLVPEALALSEYETSEKAANLVLRSSKDNSLQTRLEGLLTMGRTDAQDKGLVLRSTLVKTRRLANYDDVWDQLKNTEEVRRGLQKILPPGGKAYFVVGIMTCVDAGLEQAENRTVGVNAGVEVPVAAIALGGLPLPGLDVGLEVDRTRGENWAIGGVGVGEEVFAVEYRVVRRDWGGFGKHAVLKDDSLRGKPGLKFGSDDSDDSCDSDDSNNDDEDDDHHKEEEKGQEEDEADEENIALGVMLDPETAGKQHGQEALLDKETGLTFMFYA